MGDGSPFSLFLMPASFAHMFKHNLTVAIVVANSLLATPFLSGGKGLLAKIMVVTLQELFHTVWYLSQCPYKIVYR